MSAVAPNTHNLLGVHDRHRMTPRAQNAQVFKLLRVTL